MIDRAIVAFIDIMGYTQMVKNHMGQEELIRDIEERIRGFFHYADESRKGPDDRSEIEYGQNVASIIDIKLLSDTALFVLPISKIRYLSSPYPKEDDESNCFFVFHHFIADFCLWIMGQFGYLVRGGISIGPHYEKNLSEKRLFIFSRAYIDAYTLEKRAYWPRIIIDPTLRSILERANKDSPYNLFYEEEGNLCLDFYSSLRGDQRGQILLADIQKGIIGNLEQNLERNNREEIDKLIYFVEYHNKKVDEFDLKHLSIELYKLAKGI